MESISDDSDEEEVLDALFAYNIVDDPASMLDIELGVGVTNRVSVSSYLDFRNCLVSARRTKSPDASADCCAHGTMPTAFDIVVDSGATSTMVPWLDLFLDYKPTPGSYVLLADNTRTACLGRGTVRFKMGGTIVIITDALCIPTLRCPLYSIWCHWQSIGCALIADNSGIFLTFPNCIVPIDDSVDCLIYGSCASDNGMVCFGKRQAGRISAVHDTT